MGYGRLEFRFPCGYEILLEGKNLMFHKERVTMSMDKLPICPLHGKKCKATRKK